MNGDAQPNILKQSPHDLRPGAPELPAKTATQHWVPSRYNVRAQMKDGRLILWNTLRGAMSVFSQEQAREIVPLLSQKGFEGMPEGLAKYLADRGFLVKKGVTEYRQFQYIFGQQHYRTDALELFLLPSEDCNFRCKYCYEKFARGTMRPEVRQGVKMLVEKRIKSLKYLHVSWFGGEPLYGWAAIEDLGPYMVEMAAKHGVPYSSTMTTNGYLLTPEVADKLLAWKVNYYQITVDGPPQFHDCSRPARDGSPTFATIVENLKALSQRKEDFGITLRVNYDQQNHPHMNELFDLIRKEVGPDPRFKFRFHSVGKWGGPNDDKLQVCGVDRHEIKATLNAAANAHGLNVDTIQSVNFPGQQVCYAARPYNFIIGASGKIMKCTLVLDEDERNVLGSISPEGELVMDADKMALWTEPSYEGDSQCQKCVMLPSCQGLHCPWVRMEEHRQPCTPSRQHFKRELIEAVKYHKGGGRKKQVPVSAR